MIRPFNGFGRWKGADRWIPVVNEDGEFFDARGLKIVPPDEFRAATSEQVYAEMKERGECVLTILPMPNEKLIGEMERKSSPSLLDEMIRDPELLARVEEGIPNQQFFPNNPVVGDLVKVNGILYCWYGPTAGWK